MSATATYTEREGSEFQEWPGFSIEYRDASHRYFIHKDEERTTAISVTSALKVLDKPALVGWAERMGAEGALRMERRGALQGIEIEDALGVVRREGEGADAKKEAGADRGTAVHEALRVYCEDGTVPSISDFDPAVRGYVQGLCGWLLKAKPVPLATEQIVGSPTHGYAGRFDLLCELDGIRTIVDLKTSVRVFPEHHLQTAAYALALEECGQEPAMQGVIVAVSAEGGFDAPVCCAGRSHFLAVLGAHRALAAVRSGIKAMERTA